MSEQKDNFPPATQVSDPPPTREEHRDEERRGEKMMGEYDDE